MGERGLTSRDVQAQFLAQFPARALPCGLAALDVPAGQQPTWAQLERQATDYGRALDACLAVEDCNSFTIWGFTDKYSWVPSFSAGQGAATVMFEDYERKPAYWALRETLREASRG